jgi:pimeloyl-ACP methyl ester carboxylesterase
VAPLALVGAGAGAAAALALAQANPYLAGALMLVEFALPVAHLECFGSQGAAQAASGVAVPSGDDASAGNTDVGQTCCQPGISSPGDPAAEKFSSTQLLPWWGFRAGQASVFASVEHCAAFLAHPLANLSPQLLAPLARATQRMLAAAAAADGGPDGRTGQPSAAAGGGADQQGVAAAAAQAEEAAYMGHLLAQLQRPLGGVVASALSMLRVPAALRAGSCWGGEAEDAAGLRPRMDPAMLFSFDPAALLGGMSALRGHLLLLHGGGTASWVDPGDAGALVQLARGGGGVASTAVQVVPGAGHHLAADHPEQLLQHLIEFLEGPAINCFDRSALAAPGGGAIAGSPAAAHPSGACAAVAAAHDAAAAGGRRAELLGLRPLPQYATLEEAKKVRPISP